jgi:hypothetical protein
MSPTQELCLRSVFTEGLIRFHMLWRMRSRGRPLNAPAAFIHPCQPIVVLRRLIVALAVASALGITLCPTDSKHRG